MQRTLISGLLLLAASAGHAADSVHGFTVEDIDGTLVPLSRYQGSVLLIVNTASRCGFTHQYEGLEALYRAHKERGLVVLGFPSNDFLGQEPGTNEEIKEFCSLTYDVTFPMFSKVSVTGKKADPLYAFLTSQQTNPEFGGRITWNFNKFLVDRNGKVVGRFDSREEPGSPKITKAIEDALTIPD